MRKLDVIIIGLVFCSFIGSMLIIQQTNNYDFRYYGDGHSFSDRLNISVRFYSHDKANDTLTFLFFKDGNYTISVFYDIEGDFSTRYFIEENITVNGIGNVYPYINEAYNYVIERTNLFNPSILIDTVCGIDYIEFRTYLIGVE